MRMTTLIVGAALVSVNVSASAETPLQKETSVWQAYKDRNADAFSANMDPHYVGVYEDGNYTVARELANLRGAKIQSFSLADFKSRMVDPDDMLMHYKVNVKGTVGGHDVSGDYRAASWWHRKGGKWLGVYHTEIKAK
jgi:hypothetical protein